MTVAVITLSAQGAQVAAVILRGLSGSQGYIHDSVPGYETFERFPSVIDLTDAIFGDFNGLVYIMPTGVVVRAIAPQVQHKLRDPAVVVLDVRARWAVSLLSGHEGGANELAVQTANLTGAEPIVSTTTEAVRTLVVGVGCRRGVARDTIIAAIRQELVGVGRSVDEVRYLASADIKSDEDGLLAAAQALGVPLRFIASDRIRASDRDFQHSEFVEQKVRLPAVAEPAALLAGKWTRLIQRKQARNGVTVAIAEEDCM